MVIWKTYRKIATVQATQMDVAFAVPTLEGWMKGQAGDYLCEGAEGELWPVKKRLFKRSYVEVEGLNGEAQSTQSAGREVAPSRSRKAQAWVRASVQRLGMGFVEVFRHHRGV